MADQIILKRVFKDEYAPRFYVMTGGAFDEMLAVIKEQDFRRYENYPVKSWLIRKAGYDALKERYSIEREPDFRAAKFVESSIDDHTIGGPVRVTAYFEYREEKGDFIGIPIYKTLSIDVSDEAVEAEKAQIDAAAKEYFPDLSLTPASRYQAVREICRRAVAEYSAQVVSKFEEAMSDKPRNLDSLKAAFAAVKETLEA